MGPCPPGRHCAPRGVPWTRRLRSGGRRFLRNHIMRTDPEIDAKLGHNGSLSPPWRVPLELRKLAFDEMLRKLREEDTPRPSTKLRSSGYVNHS